MTAKRKEFLFNLGFFKSSINLNESIYERAISTRLKIPAQEVHTLTPDSFKALITTKLEIAKMFIVKDIDKALQEVSKYDETASNL